MIRRLVILLATALLVNGLTAATLTPIVSPTGAGAMGSSLTTAPDGTNYLLWLEPVDAETYALKFSKFDAAQNRWGAALMIAQGKEWMINWADFPALAVQADGRMIAVWFVNNPSQPGSGHHGGAYHAAFSTSTDGGSTWASPRPLARGSDAVEFVALQPTADGRVLAFWLDSRNREKNGDRQSLYANFINGEGPDMLLDDSVCDCCQITTATTPSGVLVAYRGRSEKEVRDIRLVDYRNGQWSQPRPLHVDNWIIAACPVNGAQLAGRGLQVAATWFTSAERQPRVFHKMSTDGGETFGREVRIDLGRPQGRVDNLFLADGTTMVTWLESATDGKDGGIYLRSISPAGALSEPQLLANASESRAGGFPRSAVRDAKRFLLSYTLEAQPSQVVTLMVTVD